jgi:hypothetical protein
MAMKLIAARRGRPQKFGRPSRAVTLTIPEDVLAALSTVDQDLSRAVVRLTQPVARRVVPHPAAEVSSYGDSAVIVVRQLKALSRIAGVMLVPLPDGRALIALDASMSVADFELLLRDAIDDERNLDKRERSALASIVEILKSARQTTNIAVQQRSIIVLQSTSHRRIAPA